MNRDLTFEWTTGSAADNMICLFRELEIPYEYDASFRLCAVIGEDKALVPVTYYRIDGNTFGIVQTPQRTTQFFGLSPDALAKDMGHTYTKEECMLLDKSPDCYPFCDTLLDALEKAAHYEAIGYDDIHILERINNRYAVIAHG